MKLLFSIASTFLIASLMNEASCFTFVPTALWPKVGCVREELALSSEAGDKNSKDDWFDDYDAFASKLDFKTWDKEEGPPLDRRQQSFDSRPSAPRTSSRGDFSSNRSGGGRREGGNSRSGGHDFTRSPDDDPSHTVDVAVIDALLTERINCKRKQDYAAADKIRDELSEEHGVTLWDKERTWTTSPNSQGGGPRHRENGRYGAGRDGGRDNGRRGESSSRFPPRNREFREERNFGPTGHDYSQAGSIDPAVCSLEEVQINQFIAQRLKYKMSRKFNEADKIKSDLFENGVSIHDGKKEWRADGEEWNDPEKQRRSREYTFRKRSGDTELPQEQIDEIIAQVILRANAKKTGDYNTADSIKAYLAERYSVGIDDTHYEWSYKSDTYSLSLNSSAPEDDVKTLIEEKLKQRAQAKAEKNYDVADAIRVELLEMYSVAIDDRTKEYSWTASSASEMYFKNVDTEEGITWEEEDNINSGITWDEEDTNNSLDVDDDVESLETSEEPLESLTSISLGQYDRKTLEGLTVPILKEKLREAGLAVSGRKDELIERLLSNN